MLINKPIPNGKRLPFAKTMKIIGKGAKNLSFDRGSMIKAMKRRKNASVNDQIVNGIYEWLIKLMADEIVKIANPRDFKKVIRLNRKSSESLKSKNIPKKDNPDIRNEALFNSSKIIFYTMKAL